MSVKERLKSFISSQKTTISAFEKEIKASNGYINSISKSIGLDKISKIKEKFPNLNLEWLLT
ncbi:transcriptional regulator, partial [Myroides odoratimimus]|nr:transcriptional regulator [Myroides odoratimimus]